MKNIKLLLILLSASILIFSSCTVEEEKDSCENIAGTWKGVYVCPQGETNLLLTIEQDGCELSALFEFSESPNNPGVPSGAARLIGQIDNSGQFDLVGSEWIDQPVGYEIADVLGSTLNSKENIRVTICGNSTVLTLQ